MSEPSGVGVHLPRVDLWRAGPGFPSPGNVVPIRCLTSRGFALAGEYVRPSYLNLLIPFPHNRGIKTTPELQFAIHYLPDDIPAVLAYLGQGWEAVAPPG